ncbi:NUDIX hydrolase domain-like protein [Phlebopus sp. FC_14]|nr:NUDIX hydrolase domain-like protein [Phlebopus sp. FC_14]
MTFNSVFDKTNCTTSPLPTSAPLSDQTKLCIERLLVCDLERPDLSGQPTEKLAAVLVLLYEKAGELRVLLTTRSKLLRAHPGQTALPGGKVDETDQSLVEAAFREAHEEVGLPINSPHVHTLRILRPFLSQSQLLVTPVVAFLTDLEVLDTLKPCIGEVDHIFSHPLEAILDPQLARKEPLVPMGSEHWLYDQELYNTSDSVIEAMDNLVYRMHRFRSSASPIKGLTADILILVAEIAYQKRTTYERYPAGEAGSTVRLVCLRIKQYTMLAGTRQPATKSVSCVEA